MRFDAELLLLLLTQLLLRFFVDEAELVAQHIQRAEGDIVGNLCAQIQAELLAVFRDIDNFVGDGDMRRGNVDGLAMEEDLARVAVHRAEERHHHLRAPRADQTGKAQNFAAADMKADVLKKTCVRQPPDLQNRLSDRNVLLGEHVGDIAADHAGNEAALRNLGNRPLTDGLAVAHDADIVAKLEDLLHAVRDIDDRAVFGGQAVDNLEESSERRWARP